MENSATGLEAEIARTGARPRRYTVIALLALATAICYVDRVNILPGIVGVALTGFIVNMTHSFAGVFYLIAFIYLAGMICYLAMGGGERRL